MEKTRVLNIDALCITEKQLLEGLDRNLTGSYDNDDDNDNTPHNGVLITPNLDHMVKLQKDEEFYRCYQEAEWVVCDSKILWLCSKWIRLCSPSVRAFPEPIPGSSFFNHYFNQFAVGSEKYAKVESGELVRPKIFLLGARTGVAKCAMEKINAKVGWPIVVGAHSPSYGFEKKPEEIEDICRIVRESGANVVLVGVGAPKQEKFICKYRKLMPEVKVWMALGATIDFEAGNIRRAPKLFRRLALEWLFRMYCEPKRMFKRYICDDLVFFWYLAKQVCGVYRNPFEGK